MPKLTNSKLPKFADYHKQISAISGGTVGKSVCRGNMAVQNPKPLATRQWLKFLRNRYIKTHIVAARKNTHRLHVCRLRRNTKIS